MSKRKYINALAKHFCSPLHIASHDLKKCIWLWVIYIKHIIIQKKYEPKEPFFKSIKNNNQYTQICYNTELKLTDNSYDLIFFEWAKKISRQPLLFFQRFPDKEYNYNFSGQEAFLSKLPKLKVTSIKPSTFFEGITFNNVIFESICLEKICFHNCIFRNCDFSNIISCKTPSLFIVPDFKQGFSACDFYNCHFKKCNLDNIFFSIGSLSHTIFDSMTLCKCLFHRMNFNHVVFLGKTIMNQTSILSPSHNFNIIFRGSMEDFHVDSRCKITAFCYHDIVNFTIRQYRTHKLFNSSTYGEIADTYYAVEQIWTSNHIREDNNHIANFYYQRKKAETRSKKGISAFPYYLLEAIIGYGEKPFKAFISIIFLILLFSFTYMFTGFTPNSSTCSINYFRNYTFDINRQTIFDWLQSLYFSFFTLITVGQGSAAPTSGITQIAMSVELLCGSIIMTLFTATLFRKYTK